MEQGKKASTIGIVVIILLSVLICCTVTLIVINFKTLEKMKTAETVDIETASGKYVLNYTSYDDCGTNYVVEINGTYEITVKSEACNGETTNYNQYKLIPEDTTKQALGDKYIPELFGNKEEVSYSSSDDNELLDNFINYISTKDESYIK